MEDISGAMVSYGAHAAEGATHAAPNSATAVAATSEALSDPWCSSPQQGTEKHQTQGIPVVDLPEQHQPHQSFPDLWQSEQQQKRRGIVSRVAQRRHSAFECVYEHHQLRSSLQQRSQQRPSQDNSGPVQLESIQQPREQQTSASYTQPMQRRLPPSLPHQHLCKVAPLHESALRRSALLRCNSSAREAACVPDPPQHSSCETHSRNLSSSSTSTSSSRELGGCLLNDNNSCQSTYNSSPNGSGPFKGSSWRCPNHGERNPPERCTSTSARTTTYSSRPLLRVSARLDTLRSWPSAASSLEKADASAAYQTDAEAVEVEQAAAESAAAAAVRSAARAAAASAAARREAHAAAAESARAGNSPDQGKTAAAHIEASSGTAAAVAEATRVTAASRTGLVATPPETRMQKTREQVRSREGGDGCSTLSNSLLAAATASGDDRWEPGEGVWAAEFVRTSTAGLLREEDTAVLTLSPELGPPTIPNVATAPAVVPTVLDTASACAAADDHHPEPGVPCSAAAGAAACDASAGRHQSATAAASPVDPCADVPALASVQRRSSEAVSVADLPAASHASAAVPSVAARPTPGLCGAAVSVGAADITTAALELPLASTAEDEQGPCTPKSSCIRASPRSCCTSRSQEPEQQLHQKQSEQTKEQLQGTETLPLSSEHGKQQTDENPLQQRPRQQQHVQQLQQQETPLQANCTDLQYKRQPSRRQQLKDGQRPQVEQCRHVPEQPQECHSLQEPAYLLFDQLSASIPSECSAGAKAVSSHGVYAEKQPSDPQQVLQQLDTLVSEQQQQPCSRRQPAHTDQQTQEHLSLSQGQQSQVVQHERHPPTPQNMKQLGTPQQEARPEIQQQQDGLRALHPQHSAEQKQGEQRAAHWNQEKRKQESERQHQQHKHEQQSPEQQPLPQRRVQEKETEVPERGDSVCKRGDTEREQTSREHAAALRELQHVVQHQQEQLQQLMQQQTLLLQQLLQRHPPAGLLARPNPGREQSVSELTHATAANSGTADLLAAGDAAVATVSQPPPIPPPAVLAPTAAAHHVRGAARAPVAESDPTVQVSNASAAGTGNTDIATCEKSCYMQDSGVKKREESDLSSSQQGVQQSKRTQSKREISQMETTQVQASTRQANHLQQDRQYEALIGYELQKPTPLLQRAQEKLQEQQMRQLFCAKQLLQGEQEFWGPSQQQSPCVQKEQPRRQRLMLQEEPPLRERQQHHLFEKRPDMQQLQLKKSALRSTEERYSISRSLLLQPATPPVLSPRVMLASFDQLPVVHRKACANPVPLCKKSPAGTAKGSDAAAVFTEVLATAGSASTAACAVAAAACAADAPTAAAHGSTTAQASILRPAPTTAAAGGSVEGVVQGAAASVSHVFQQQRDVGVSPLPLQHQQQGRRRSTPADTNTPSYHTAPRDSSSSSSSKERPLVEASLSRLSTDPGSQQQAHDHKEPWYPRSLVLEQHSLPGLDCRGDRKDAGEGLPSAAHVEFEKAEEAPAAAAMPALLAADEQGRQHSLCTAELLRRQQWELQQKLQRLQERMQQLQQQQMALDPSLVLSQQEHATGADSPLQQQLPILLNSTSLQGATKQQQHQEMPQRQQNAQHSFEDCVLVHHPCRWSSANNSGVLGLADSVGSASSRESLRQRALSSTCASGAAGTFCSSFTADALSEQCCMLAPSSRSLHYGLLQLEEAPAQAMPAAAGGATNAAAAAAAAATGHAVAEDVFKTHAGRFSAQAVATTPGRRSSATASAEGRAAAFPFAGNTREPLSPPGDCILRLFPSGDSAARTPGDSRLAVAEPGLFVSATPVPAVPPLAAAEAPSVHQCSASQRESENARKAPFISICYSLSDASPGKGVAARQLCSPGTAAAAAVERTGQQEPLKQVRGSAPLHASTTGRKAAGDDEVLDEGEQGPLHRPPLALPGLQKVLQQQDILQDFSHGAAGVLPQQRRRRILDQDEQIVPSVLKRLLLQQQQQQQEGRGDRDGVGLFSSLALQHHNETCWWEETASSRSPGKKQQQRRQGQLSRRLATSEKQQQQQWRKRLGSSRSEGTVASTADTRRRPTARLSGDCVARNAPARRQQAAQPKSDRPSNPTLCSSALESWANSHGNRLSSSSSHDVVSKRNRNHVSRSGNSKRIISVPSSTRPTTGHSCCSSSAQANDHNDGPRAKGLQQRQCSSRQDGDCQSTALPSAALGTDFEQPRQKEAAKAGAFLLPADSASASPLGEVGGYTRPTSSEFLAGHGAAAGDFEAPASSGSSAAGSQDSIPGKHVAEQRLARESSSYDRQDCGTTDKSGSVFLLTPHDTSGSSRQHLQQQAGSPCDAIRQEARSRGDSSSRKQNGRQRGELGSPSAPRRAPSFAAEERNLTADNRSNVDKITGESLHQLGRRMATLQPVESSGSPQAAERKSKSGRAPQPGSTMRGCAAAVAAGLLQSVPSCSRPSGADRPTNISEEKSSDVPLYEEEPSAHQHAPPAHQQRTHAYQRQSEFPHLHHAASPPQQHANLPFKQQDTRSQAQQMPVDKQTPVGHNSNARLSSTSRGLLCSRGSPPSSKTNASAGSVSVTAAADSEIGAAVLITAAATAEASLATTTREAEAALPDVSGTAVAAKRSSPHQLSEPPQAATAAEHRTCLPQMQQRGSEGVTREPAAPYSSTSHVAERPTRNLTNSERLPRTSRSAQRLATTSYSSAAPAATATKQMRNTLVTARTRQAATAFTEGKAFLADVSAAPTSSECERTQQPSVAAVSPVADAPSYFRSKSNSSSATVRVDEKLAVADDKRQHSKQKDRQQRHKALQMGKPGAGEVAEDDTGTHSSSEAAAASAGQYSRLLSFLEIPQSKRQPRGQETAALVQIFLSQQHHFACAATARGAGRQRSTGTGIPYLIPDSRFCVDQLKHLREDPAGDTHYVVGAQRR